MSKLQDILLEAKRGLAPWQKIPESQWPQIASRCREAELAEIDDRLSRLEHELATVEDWDGDTRDDIYSTISMFRALSVPATGNKA